MPRRALRVVSAVDAPADVTPLQRIARALHLIADALAQMDASTSSELLTAGQMLERYGMGKAAADARGIPRARVGRAFKWRRSDIETAIQATPVRPRPAKSPKVGNELDQLVASGRARR